MTISVFRVFNSTNHLGAPMIKITSGSLLLGSQQNVAYRNPEPVQSHSHNHNVFL